MYCLIHNEHKLGLFSIPKEISSEINLPVFKNISDFKTYMTLHISYDELYSFHTDSRSFIPEHLYTK